MPSEKGSIFIATLVILLVVTLLCIFTFKELHDTGLLIGEEIHSVEAKASARNDALSLNFETSQPGFSCSHAMAKKGLINIERFLCGITFPSQEVLSTNPLINGQNSPFPAFDFDSFFQNLSDCNKVPLHSTRQSPLGFALNPSALLSVFSCLEIPHSPVAREVFDANLAISKDLEFRLPPNSSQVASILAATGFIDLSGEVSVSSNALILSGGDLHISMLNSPPVPSLNITLLSATGRVVLDNISGSAKLRVLGRAGVLIPQNTILETHNILPESIEELVLAVSR